MSALFTNQEIIDIEVEQIEPENPGDELVDSEPFMEPRAPRHDSSPKQNANGRLPVAAKSSAKTAPELSANTSKQEEVLWLEAGALKPHPLNVTLYGATVIDKDFQASIKETGVINPLIVTADGVILAGHRRHAAATACGHKLVPVIIRTFGNELDAQRALVVSNQHRLKTNEMLGREARLLKEIETKRARERQALGGKAKKGGTAKEDKGPAREKVGVLIGTSGATADELIKAVNLIDEIEAGKEPGDAKLVREKLVKSPAAAFRAAKSLGYSSANPKKGASNSPLEKSQAEPASAATRVAQNNLPNIKDHKQVMEWMNQVIAYVEELETAAVGENHKREWQETMGALTDALSDAGILHG